MSSHADVEEEGTLQGSLLKAVKLQLLREQAQLESRSVVLSPVALCSVCAKRIPRGEAVVTADERVWHQSCYRASSAAATAVSATAGGVG